MRAGGCGIHQSLTPEAATVVKQAINLARRRGHAQVTPIHVATVMLASPAGLLRSACLKSANSFPYQCKALELCFNVSLNRLPATTAAPILAPHHHSHNYPTLANALMAAFKRAQAHQRRGSIEAQQQPILALKIETEQLVISILDDPSVSRVMREAGFSSTLVKSHVEQSLSSSPEVSSQTTTTTNNNVISTLKPNQTLLPLSPFELGFSKPFSQARSEDVSSVIDAWVKRREKSSVVLVGECLGSCEGVVRGVKERVERGDVPMELRYVQFLNCPLASMKNLAREEIDMKLGEMRCLVKGCGGRGVVMYLGDLKWVAEYWADYNNSDQLKKQSYYYYCPVEHLVMGLRRLVFGHVENGRVWLMGISTFSSYMKCKAGNPSLETLLDLHALTIPSANLVLGLNLDSNKSSVSGDGVSSWPLVETKIDIRLNESTTTTDTTTTNSSLPSWLQKCKEESTGLSTNDQEETVQMKELCIKGNLIRNKTEKTINFASCSPSCSTSICSYDNHSLNPQSHETKPSWPIIIESRWASKLEHQFLTPNSPKAELLSNPNSTPNSASSSEATEPVVVDRFKENNLENLKVLCSALEKKVPRQKDIIPEIATTILRCRSGSSKQGSRVKQETWLFFMGSDDGGKHKMARELGRVVFGTQTSSFKSVGLSSFSSSTRADSNEMDSSKNNNKRARDESGHGLIERLAHAVRENPHRVFYVEDVEQLDQGSQKGIRRAMETGKFFLSDGETVPLEDAIVIFSCESFSYASRACSPRIKQKLEEGDDHEDGETSKVDDVDEASSSLPLDLNIPVDDDHDDDEDYDSRVGDIVRIVEAVDKQIFFRIQLL